MKAANLPHYLRLKHTVEYNKVVKACEEAQLVMCEPKVKEMSLSINTKHFFCAYIWFVPCG